ncbi:hypothetical protein SEA_BIG4_229 [Microbacterium phage Big4]|nr:hypothetical protein SEA_BIG4_229 [Microbacterium phage Big4]
MEVSIREEALARNLYEIDLNDHQAEDVPWEKAIEQVKTSYRRQARKVFNSRWFMKELEGAWTAGVMGVDLP